MPETPTPTPTRDRPVSRNLFVEADPDLDTLAQSRTDESARSDRGRRRGRGLVVLVERYRAPHTARAHDGERFSRLNGNAARWRAAACHAIWQADAAAGRLLRDLATRRFCALVTIVALTLLLGAFSWLVLDVHDTSTARAAANGQLARNPLTLRHQQARIEALTAEVRQVALTARESETSVAPARPLDVGPRPMARKPPTARGYHRHRLSP
jgi:hypothetical protein